MRFRLDLDTTDGKERYIEWVDGPRPYIWIGDDEHGCYGTLEPKAAQRLGKAIVKTVPAEATKDESIYKDQDEQGEKP